MFKAIFKKHSPTKRLFTPINLLSSNLPKPKAPKLPALLLPQAKILTSRGLDFKIDHKALTVSAFQAIKL